MRAFDDVKKPQILPLTIISRAEQDLLAMKGWDSIKVPIKDKSRTYFEDLFCDGTTMTEDGKPQAALTFFGLHGDSVQHSRNPENPAYQRFMNDLNEVTRFMTKRDHRNALSEPS